MVKMDALAKVRGVLLSRSTRRALMNLGLVMGSALSLLVIAIVATALFFTHYLPDQTLSWPVYLQYGSGPNPGGMVVLGEALPKAQQEYDISVTLTLPRSPPNTQLGNFMVGVYLADRDISNQHEPQSRVYPDRDAPTDTDSVIFSSRRPALIPYEDPILLLASRILFLPYLLLRSGITPRTMIISMAEQVSFSRGSALPRSIYVEVEAGQTIQIYSASITLTAKLSGLRWVLHHYRLLAFLTLSGTFWALELIFTSLALLFLTAIVGSGEGPRSNTGLFPEPAKQEHEEEQEHRGNQEGKGISRMPIKQEEEADDDRTVANIPGPNSANTELDSEVKAMGVGANVAAPDRLAREQEQPSGESPEEDC